MPRGVTVWFGLDWFSVKKMSKPIKPSTVWIGSVFTVFQKRNRTKLISLVRFGLVQLIGLFKNTIKKNSYSHKIFHRTLYNCISYFEI